MKQQALRSSQIRIVPFPTETFMKTPFLLLAALGGLTTASAEIPNSLLFQGYLTQGNAPLTGEQTLLVKACDALTDGTCKTVFNGPIQATSGYYTALLENLPVMDKPYWLEVASNGTLLPSRIALTSSPYALRAASSQKADSATYAAKAGSAGKADSAGFAVKADTAKFASNAGASLKADTAAVANKAIYTDTAYAAQRATQCVQATFADSARSASKADSAASALLAWNVNGGVIQSLNDLQGAIHLSAGNGLTMEQTNTNHQITLSINSELTIPGNLTASNFTFIAPKAHIMDIGISDISNSTSTSTSSSWSIYQGGMQATCPIGNNIGNINLSKILDLPEGALVDSIALYAWDHVGYPIFLNISRTSYTSPTASIVFGSAYTSATPINTAPAPISGYQFYRKVWNAASPITINKSNSEYRINLGNPTGQISCSLYTSVNLRKISVYYRMSTL